MKHVMVEKNQYYMNQSSESKKVNRGCFEDIQLTQRF